MRQAIYSSFAAVAGDTAPLPHIEPLVECQQFSLTHVSFLTRLVAEVAPPGTVIMVIANFITERTERLIGVVEHKQVFFEGTNTGAFGWLIEDLGIHECFELEDPGFVPFGGKFVHAPAIGRVLAGTPLQDLGRPFGKEKIRSHRLIPGEIVHIDNFGNAKIFLRDLKFPLGAHLVVEFPDSNLPPITAVLGTRMMEHPASAWVVYRGSSLGLYELGRVRERGFLDLPIKVGAHVQLTVVE